ncbi:M23 family metallopeptidase [Microbacterium gilvum]|uniref:M23ase beta-sheet core domain-containing protein n=1 Tax=Microbacterium gilvum TaxID=1336204 RepID=A0ABP9A7Q1_9MICO
MVDDLSDAWAEIRKMQKKIRRLENTTMLEDSAIENGRMRFIGGELRLDSGATLTLIGTMNANGTVNITGLLNGSGQLVWSGSVEFTGPWNFEGDGTISGDVTATGKWTQNGPIDINGAWSLDGDGDITGDVDLTGDMNVVGGGKIIVGTGSNIVQLDSTFNSPRANFGLSQIVGSPTGQSFTFTMPGSTDVIYFTNGTIRIPNIQDLPSGTAAKYVVADLLGNLYLSSGVGGGGDPEPGEDLGNFQWPFPLTSVTSEYGPRTTPYTGFHEGIDFGISPAVAGAPIIAAGDGVVAVSQGGSPSTGWGNYVRITHTLDGGQQVSTLYGHMNATPLVGVGATVTKGQVIGYVGNTGNSFGAHLHFETWMGTSYGTHINPRSFMAAYGPE